MNQPSSTELADSFRRYFTLVPALDDALRRETYRIRHDVYCHDLGWEPPRADELETDDYDRHSLPCLMRAAQTGTRVGCLRLVLCPPEEPLRPLPMERTCAHTLDHALIERFEPDRRRIAEVSRLAVTRDYRRRKGEADKPIALEQSDFGEGAQQRFPFIPVGLYLSAFALAAQLDLSYLLVLTEPRLARHLGRIGLDIHQIGEPVEHRGVRIPSIMDTRATIANLHPLTHRLWDQIHDDIAAAFAAAGSAALP
ncbi:MAG TPA: PEP-CTERM/exosortase system-associated acyltransferase [Candidatus Acidoferrum sp.]|nr:PEP-CTERM/exosortase system-associated acyltransferase [Candidatus Acidoferrum sp.]